MLRGIGVDLCRTDRIGRLERLYGDRFLRRAFHENEITIAKGKPCDRTRQEYLASRWALKEALLKAVGYRIDFCEIESANLSVRLHGSASQRLSNYAIYSSLSHDSDYAIAFVTVTNAVA